MSTPPPNQDSVIDPKLLKILGALVVGGALLLALLHFTSSSGDKAPLNKSATPGEVTSEGIGQLKSGKYEGPLISFVLPKGFSSLSNQSSQQNEFVRFEVGDNTVSINVQPDYYSLNLREYLNRIGKDNLKIETWANLPAAREAGSSVLVLHTRDKGYNVTVQVRGPDRIKLLNALSQSYEMV